MKLPFVKMEGCGNDFIVCRPSREVPVEALIDAAPRLCDRSRGIGADGLIIALPSQSADVRMRIINADGSEAQMCGNGVRCLARFVAADAATPAALLRVETLAGLITVRCCENGWYEVGMGAPVLGGPDIPVGSSRDPVVDEMIEAGSRTCSITAVSMGNPHAVIEDDGLSDETVEAVGAALQNHPFFPQRVNVEFVRMENRGEMTMRVFERGVGETLACGTGACAAVVASILRGRCDDTVTVHLRGGDVEVSWDGERDHQVFLRGPAREVFEGVTGDW